MSILLDHFLQPIEASPAAELEQLDERLLRIDALAEKSLFSDAAGEVVKLVDDGIYDIRPLPYLFYQAFVERGFDALPVLLQALDNLLGASLVALTPQRRRVELINKRLAWLFDAIVRFVEYHEQQGTEEWARLRDTLHKDVVGMIGERGQRLIEQRLRSGNDDAASALRQLLGRVKSYAEGNEPVGQAELATGGKCSASERQTSEDLGIGLLAHSGMADGGLVAMNLLVSHAFVELCRRLRAFEQLVERHEFLKAAVLAADITVSTEAFDPRAHFPAMFARAAALESRNAVALAEAASDRGSPTWTALAQYARVDLSGFVKDDQ